VSADDLAETTTAWTDQWWDPDVGLIWMPPDPPPDASGSEVPVPGLHLLPQTAWYAAGLLRRDDRGDHERAVAALGTILDHQYDAPGEVWHGTFTLVHESREPRPGARIWVDYDPNWRQFIGCTLLLVLRHFDTALPRDLVERIDRALRLVVEGEPDRRISDGYSNIALMHSYVEVEAGLRLDQPAWIEAGEARAGRVSKRFDRFGAFEEYNSPTYYGIDLLALGLWSRHSSSPTLTSAGARLEAAVWQDSVRWYHAGLANVAGPYTRSYGMDLHRYVAAWGLWVWAALGRERAPVPALDGPLEHGMDLTLGPMIALIGADLPIGAQVHLEAFQGERIVRQRISNAEHGDRTATAWLGSDVMLGAERNTIDLSWWDQFHPATAHWRRDDGSVGWLQARVPGVSDTTVEPGRLTIRWHHDEDPDAEGDVMARFLLDRPAAEDALGPLQLTSTGPPPGFDGTSLTARPGTGSETTFTVEVAAGR